MLHVVGAQAGLDVSHGICRECHQRCCQYRCGITLHHNDLTLTAFTINRLDLGQATCQQLGQRLALAHHVEAVMNRNVKETDGIAHQLIVLSIENHFDIEARIILREQDQKGRV